MKWKVKYKNYRPRVVDSSNRLVCLFPFRTNGDTVNTEYAKLIAAAPDMYTMLVALSNDPNISTATVRKIESLLQKAS